jgi:dUTPase
MRYEVISEHPDGSFTTRLSKNDDVIKVKRGDRICQLILLEVPEVNLIQVDNLDDGGTRGTSGFGSSGVRGERL